MERKSRFDCVSGSLHLSGALGESRRVLGLCLALGVLAHLSLTRIVALEAEQKVARPLTTQFVKRQPRLTKPLELKKRPEPKRRQVQREMVAVKARASTQQGEHAFRPREVLRGLARPEAGIGRAASLLPQMGEPRALAAAITGQKEAKNITDMPLDMLDIETLDTGRYWAVVVQDPTDRKAMKGFLHLASAYPAGMPRPGSETGPWPVIIRPLIDAMNRFTDIKTDYQGKIGFDSRELLKLPFLYTRIWWVFNLTSGEAERLGSYLTSGGFLFAETIPPGQHQFLPAYEGVKEMVGEALSTQGVEENKGWHLERLPNSHPAYHCYFDFAGPPAGTAEMFPQFQNFEYLEGVILDGKVPAILCQKNYALLWMNYTSRSTRQLQFGVNMIVFALTQEGSITNRVMNSVSY